MVAAMEHDLFPELLAKQAQLSLDVHFFQARVRAHDIAEQILRVGPAEYDRPVGLNDRWRGTGQGHFVPGPERKHFLSIPDQPAYFAGAAGQSHPGTGYLVQLAAKDFRVPQDFLAPVFRQAVQ